MTHRKRINRAALDAIAQLLAEIPTEDFATKLLFAYLSNSLDQAHHRRSLRRVANLVRFVSACDPPLLLDCAGRLIPVPELERQRDLLWTVADAIDDALFPHRSDDG